MVFYRVRRIVATGVPTPILQKGIAIIRRIESGQAAYWQLRGHRLNRNRNMISIPIGPNWRIIAQENKGGIITFKAIVSHSKYNQRIRR